MQSVRGIIWQHEVSKLYNYMKYQWQVCGDLEVFAIFLGLQQSYMKFCCLLSEWNSQVKTFHYKKRDWPCWPSLELGTKNAQHILLIESSNILLPSVHIRLGLMKNFFKVMDQTGSAFRYFTEKFPGISIAKTKEGVFFGPQMCKLLRHTVWPNSHL